MLFRSLAAADVGDALERSLADVFEHQLDVIDARIDGGWVVFFVVGGLVEERADLGSARGRATLS